MGHFHDLLRDHPCGVLYHSGMDRERERGKSGKIWTLDGVSCRGNWGNLQRKVSVSSTPPILAWNEEVGDQFKI